MKLLVLLTCLLAACLAEKPHPCVTGQLLDSFSGLDLCFDKENVSVFPHSKSSLLSGALTVSTQNEELWTYAKYLYDALGHRVRLLELGAYQNKSFTYDALLLYREAAMYEIHAHNRTCQKKPLKVEFHPIAVPKDASLLGQAVLGSSSGPGQGLLVNSWTGDLPDKSGKYMTTVTEFGCIPVSTAYHTKEFRWVVTSFFNNVIGIEDPDLLNPQAFALTQR